LNIIEEWKKKLINNEFSINTLNCYLEDLNKLFKWLVENEKLIKININEIKKINILDLNNYIYYLTKEKKYSANTKYRKISAIKNFYNFLENYDLINSQENLGKKLQLPKLPNKEKGYLNENETQNFISNINTRNKIRDKAITTLFITTGLRLNELINIKLEDINNSSIKIIGKGNKERVVYLTEKTTNAINDWITIRDKQIGVKTNALFINERKTQIKPRATQHVIKKLFNNANRNDCSTHSLRHTCATLQLKNGVDIRIIQENLGHASLNTTARYAHIMDEEQRRKATNGIDDKI
jgi:site-specific recombinase XerD